MPKQNPIIHTYTPFLKWAGGKRWLVERYADLIDVSYERFVEPFLGSGAVYFHLAPKRALLSDKNKDLIETYTAIRDESTELTKILKKHHARHSTEYYYKVRSSKPRTRASRAARFIYLNRTCWNGLYRVNLKGEFNVPIGTKKNVILETDDFHELSALFGNVDFSVGDFSETFEKVRSGDFIFVDPPYTVKHNHNGFIKYNEKLFSWEDQVRLKSCVEVAIKKGAKVLVTNAYHDSTIELYQGVGEILTVNRQSVISGKSKARGIYEEMLIKCF